MTPPSSEVVAELVATIETKGRIIFHEAADGVTRSIVPEPDGQALVAGDVVGRSWTVRYLDGDLYLSILRTDVVAALLRREEDGWAGPWLNWGHDRL